MTLNLTIPQTVHTDFSPRITVIGVGGGGTNAVDNMITANLQGVEFVVANTDAQQLMHSRADRRIQLGPHITQGLGAGAKPEIGKAAAEEASDELARHLDGAHMVFITAGMGGGTGTGAAPVIARMARERNILTVGVVTKPFGFEGVRRSRCADQGIEELQRHVDTLIVIPNQNLFRMANERTTWKEAFKMADQVLYMGVRGVTDLMMAPGLVNLDFADIRTVMAEMGKAMMGTGEAEGENRAIRAAEAAISNPLLEDTSMSGAQGLLINITGGDDLTLFEVDQAANRIREEVDEEANIIFGSAIDETLSGRIRVSVVATGIDSPAQGQGERPRLVAVGGSAMPMPQPIPLPMHAAAAAVTMPAGAGLAPAPVMSAQGHPLRQPAPQLVNVADAVPDTASMMEMASMSAPQPIPHPVGPVHSMTPVHSVTASVQAVGITQPRAASGASRASLFAEPRRPAGDPAAPQVAPESTRPSLFSTVTGAFRRRQHPGAVEPAAPVRAEPVVQAVARAEPPQASVRQTAGEEVGLDIPAFLRRQSS
ncbi:MAG TPA: cell division protein FtsZ [Acetobacteraceae bacterium]|nr:cell division protein FtsZ [Acetobacteraceae bacterium]